MRKKTPAPSAGRFLAIKNWEKFNPTDRLRHKNAKLPWIKIYLELDFDIEWQKLTGFQRALLQGVWMLRGKRGKNPHNDAMWIARSLAVLPEERRCVPQALKRLIAEGWLIPTDDEGIVTPPCTHREPTVNRPWHLQALWNEQNSPREGEREGDIYPPTPLNRGATRKKRGRKPTYSEGLGSYVPDHCSCCGGPEPCTKPECLAQIDAIRRRVMGHA